MSGGFINSLKSRRKVSGHVNTPNIAISGKLANFETLIFPLRKKM
jgi:hypothetical protein